MIADCCRHQLKPFSHAHAYMVHTLRFNMVSWINGIMCSPDGQAQMHSNPSMLYGARAT